MEKSPHPSFRQAFLFWLKLGFISFGGPTGQIAIMHEELVEKRRWISEERFLHALNFCMLLPGPEAQQLAIYIGWLLHKTRGGIVAGVLFVLPSMVILWGLSLVYVTYGNQPAMVGIFHGLKPAVLAIVIGAVIRIGRRILKNEAMWTLAGLAFVAIHWWRVPFPLIILAAATIGFIGGQFWPGKFLVGGAHESSGKPPSILGDESTVLEHTRSSAARAAKVAVVGIALWTLPIVLLALGLGTHHTLFREAIFFSKASMVTFGGAYAVLPYVSQQAVETYHWLRPDQMLDGLGLAETTPGPLIMVLQFVGFLGAWNHPGPLRPLVAATLGALISTWTTFVPCFLWVFLGAPHNEQLRGNVKLRAALSGVTAAIVGVILNLAVWFGQQLLFPAGAAIDGFALFIASVALVAIVRFKSGVIPIVIGGALLGLAHRFIQ